MSLEERLGAIGPVRAAAGVTVFAAAFGVAVLVPRRVQAPYAEPLLALVALALLGGAVATGWSERTRIAYRRSVWVLLGVLVGVWSHVAGAPLLPGLMLALVVWTALAAVEFYWLYG